MINKIAIACFKKDLALLRPCVASIRYWYPEVEIFLIKDFVFGDFSTSEIEKLYNVKIFPSKRKTFGWPWSKLAVVLHEDKDKYLFLDSDVVFLGRVLDRLSSFDEDFVVTGMRTSDANNPTFTNNYIDTDKLRSFDNHYHFPGYGFNGGQIVMTSGLLREADCNSVIAFEPEISNKRPDIFKHGDQGALNYIFAKAAQAGKIRVRYEDFWIWPGLPSANEISLDSIRRGDGIPYILHWAGIKPVDFRKFSRYDILKFFEDQYYSRLPNGNFLQMIRFLSRLAVVKAKIFKYRLLRKPYA